MLQRTIFRQRRAVQSALSRSTYSSTSLSLRQTSPLQQLAHSVRPSPYRSIARSYSTENGNGKDEAKKENEDAAAGQTDAAESTENALKKELDAKNKEVIDLKV
jgi:molecular chaperone GrpE